MDFNTLDKTFWRPSLSDLNHVKDKEYSCELDKIARLYNADKGMLQEMSNKYMNANGLGWDNNKRVILPGHNYVELYEKYLSHLRYKEFNLLEIGMGNNPTNGYSLRMWLDFFPNAKIDIIDNNPNNFICNFEYDVSRVNFYVVDQGNKESINKFIGICNKTYDVIIDDGSHIPEHQILTYSSLFGPILKNEGIYIIEDLFENLNNKEVHNNILLYLAYESIRLQSNCLLDKHPDRNIHDISSIHTYRSIVFIFKNTNKVSR